MNKKIASVAAAGLFAAPVTALAQSSVTISGVLKAGFENLKLNNFSSLRTGAETNKSQHGVVDDLSRIIFNIREDLGGGLSAIGQLDMRVKPDDNQGTAVATGATPTSGNSHVGLASKAWGRIFFGRQDLHFFNTSSNIAVRNSMRADSVSLLAFAGAWSPVSGSAVNGGVAVAGATRTQNVVHYTTPTWGGFTGIAAYSSNPIATEGDIGSAIRRGYAWNLNPSYAAANWHVGYSFWKSKPDGGLTTATPGPTTSAAIDQRAHRLYGEYSFGFGLGIGLAWDKSKLEGNGVTDGTTFSKRAVWSIPAHYTIVDRHQITGHYTWARSDQASLADGLSTKANMWAIGYSYDLSRRTSIGVTYARINNQANAGYTFYNSASQGLGAAGVMAGEDPRMFGTTLRHAF
jgi:predicted porin